MYKLMAPCTYQGGKQRLATQIVDYIIEKVSMKKSTKFYDLCCGSGAVTIEMINRGFAPENIIMCDISSWGKFWQTIGDGTFDFEKFLEYANAIPTDKALIQAHMNIMAKENASIDEEYKYPILQSAAFGGKQIWRKNDEWKNTSFRRYWQPTENSNRKSLVNPMMPMTDELIRRIRNIVECCKGLTCVQGDIKNALSLLLSEDCIIYIDPPYVNTTKYGFELNLNEILLEIGKRVNAPVFVSEKEKISDIAVQLNFNSAKGGISGNKGTRNSEWLNYFNM